MAETNLRAEENDAATTELLDTLDALYPLPIARRRKERAIQTAEAVAKWMRAQFTALEDQVPVVMSAALAAVQQEERERCAKLIELNPNLFRAELIQIIRDKPLREALRAPKAPRPEAASQSLRGDVKELFKYPRDDQGIALCHHGRRIACDECVTEEENDR